MACDCQWNCLVGIEEHERRIEALEAMVGSLTTALWAAAGITDEDLARARQSDGGKH